MFGQLVEEEAVARYASEMLVGIQITAARALLQITADELAEMAGVSLSTLKRAKSSATEVPTVNARNLSKIESALETAGIVFLSAGQLADGGLGLRLRR